MFRRRVLMRLSATLTAKLSFGLLLFILAFSGGGCRRSAHTSDSRLQQIDKMLNAQLPPGTPRSRVEFFLSSRGYRVENVRDKATMIAIIRHVDIKTLQPVTARVTFHFDLNEKLLTYELQYAPDAPFQP